MQRIRTLICDDIDTLVKRYMRALSGSQEIEIVGTANSGTESIELAQSLNPDVILMDVEMETRDAGIQAAQKILKILPDTRIIICTIYEESELINRAFNAGGVDYLIKDMPMQIIRESVINAYFDQVVIQPRIVDALKEELSRVSKLNQSLLMLFNNFMLLTPSEITLIGLMLKGKKRADICEERVVELSTVKSQINSILRKMNMHTMRELLDFINSMGLTHVFFKS